MPVKFGGPTPPGLLPPNSLFGEPGPVALDGPPGPDIKDPKAFGKLKVLLLDDASNPCELTGGCIFPAFPPPKFKPDPNWLAKLAKGSVGLL